MYVWLILLSVSDISCFLCFGILVCEFILSELVPSLSLCLPLSLSSPAYHYHFGKLAVASTWHPESHCGDEVVTDGVLGQLCWFSSWLISGYEMMSVFSQFPE